MVTPPTTIPGITLTVVQNWLALGGHSWYILNGKTMAYVIIPTAAGCSLSGMCLQGMKEEGDQVDHVDHVSLLCMP